MPLALIGFGPWELGIVLLIVIIVFGVGKLPKVLGQLGEGVRSFRDAAAGNEEDDAPSDPPSQDT